MKIKLRKLKIVDPGSAYHGQMKDIVIDNGIVSSITDSSKDAVDQEFDFTGMALLPGLVDSAVHYRDPGFESYESIKSLGAQARSAGISKLVGFPNTEPIVQSKEALAYFKNAEEHVDFYNLAALTKNCAGEDFSELNDLVHHGAVGFSDGTRSLNNSDILYKAFLYAKALNTVIVTKPQDKYLSMYGQIHEGVISTQLGLKGIPAIAEEIVIQRDLALLEYADVKHHRPILHFSTISTAKSVVLIRKAKKAGLAVSCDIAAHQLVYTDHDLLDFDTNLKVCPPFRSKDDIKALKEGLKDGTIDAIVSDHSPWSQEHKFLEFDLASNGITGIETLFAISHMYSGLDMQDLVQKLHYNPCGIYSLPSSALQVGQAADFAVFDLEKSYTFSQSASLSANSPFFGQTLKGLCVAYFKNGHYQKNLQHA